MEEDLKILEHIAMAYKDDKEVNSSLVNIVTSTLITNEELAQAIENLLTRYKELQLTDKEKEVVEAYRNLVKHTGSDSWVVCDPKQMWSNYFIPKSKVKEKIEELDNKRRKFTSDNVNNFYLQEFTRKYTQKSDHDYGVFSTPETITYCTNNELLGRVEVLQELLREE